jgi:hypothetical protein
MNINELLLKPTKPKKKKAKILKEAFPFPDDQVPVVIGGITFDPPFYPMAANIEDKNGQLLCTCANNGVAKALVDLIDRVM